MITIDENYDDKKPVAPAMDEYRERADLQRKWEARIEKQEKENEDYYSEVKRSLKWLRLDKESRKRKAGGEKLNIAFANYEVLRSTVYSRPPQIVVQPRFGGGPMRAQLNAISEVIERAVASEIEREGLHDTAKIVRDEMLKTGRGVLWCRYEAEFEDLPSLEMPEEPDIDPMGEEPPMPMQIKKSERICFDAVTWRNFLHGPAKTWKEVPWVARWEAMTREEVKERFGLDKARQDEIGLAFGENEQFSGSDAPKTSEGSTCKVYEVWCRESKKVYFVAKGAAYLIEEPSDPLINVHGFFPCPEPAMSVTQDGTVRPIPDVIMIEDQLVTIDHMTSRIRALEQSLKVRGFYGKGATDTTAADAIEEAVRSNDDRQIIIPVPSFAAGGEAKLDVVWLPIDAVVQALTTLREQRREAIELVYQVTGISDVMRGDSQASETLGAQQIKDRWGNVRVRDKQEEMRRVVRDACRIAAEIMCEMFEPQRIAESALYGFDEQMVPMLRDDRGRSLAIDVETDSTIQSDEQEEKQRRTEFTQAVGGLIQQMFPIIQQVPEMLPFAASLIKFNVRGFRVGREIEKDLDQMIDALTQKAQNPPPPQPTPDDKKIAAKQKSDEMNAQLEIRKQDIDASLRERELAMRAGIALPMAAN